MAKKFPQNVRALRLVIEENIRGPNSGDAPPPPGSMPELMNKLSELSKKSRTTKAWVDNVIRLVLLINMFCRAAHEGDFDLHYVCCWPTKLLTLWDVIRGMDAQSALRSP